PPLLAPQRWCSSPARDAPPLLRFVSEPTRNRMNNVAQADNPVKANIGWVEAPPGFEPGITDCGSAAFSTWRRGLCPNLPQATRSSERTTVWTWHVPAWGRQGPGFVPGPSAFLGPLRGSLTAGRAAAVQSGGGPGHPLRPVPGPS